MVNLAQLKTYKQEKEKPSACCDPTAKLGNCPICHENHWSVPYKIDVAMIPGCASPFKSSISLVHCNNCGYLRVLF